MKGQSSDGAKYADEVCRSGAKSVGGEKSAAPQRV